MSARSLRIWILRNSTYFSIYRINDEIETPPLHFFSILFILVKNLELCTTENFLNAFSCCFDYYTSLLFSQIRMEIIDLFNPHLSVGRDISMM
ncbi:hypothetical protein SLEP1_g7106 [Rubroshorea leprosula]|uniref:Maturase K n=1 Tax=Rubroshorea leprosula TaxID=152421 RepID=A0AAV5HXM5_9ROSI|nr:hypothetical protein SLEP1_g7106 [Rubroshorea leprosula]